MMYYIFYNKQVIFKFILKSYIIFKSINSLKNIVNVIFIFCYIFYTFFNLQSLIKKETELLKLYYYKLALNSAFIDCFARPTYYSLSRTKQSLM